MRARLAAAIVAAVLASVAGAAPAAGAGARAAGAIETKQAEKQAPDAKLSRQDDAEQRGHVIPDPPRRADPTPAPAPPPATPPVSASPARAVSPAPVAAAAPRRPELPRTGGDDALLLLWFAALVIGAGACLRRAIA